MEESAAPEQEGASVVTPVVSVKAKADADEPKAEKNKAKKDGGKKEKSDKKDEQEDEPKAKLKPRVADTVPEWNEPVTW